MLAVKEYDALARGHVASLVSQQIALATRHQAAKYNHCKRCR